ncbi:hypothetical protein RJT34_20325 [Clitoria ternatea]|uniref:Uncharacterized protein n=1 Tax=Clitoria ternatea TaxID=43366 RepID=A0AAN9ISM6_CLITE
MQGTSSFLFPLFQPEEYDCHGWEFYKLTLLSEPLLIKVPKVPVIDSHSVEQFPGLMPRAATMWRHLCVGGMLR